MPTTPDAAPAIPRGANVILIDGTCIFCNRLVSFILDHDHRGLFRFAHIQGDFARDAFARHGLVADIDAIYLVADAGTDAEQVLIDGAAGRRIWPRLFRLAAIMRVIPLAILNWGYRFFARHRYRWFGQYTACRVPSADERARFLA